MPRIRILKIFLCLLLLVPCCKNNSDKKIYRTTTHDKLGLQMFHDNPIKNDVDLLMHIPFKSKVEIIDNKSTDGYVKIKYKDIIGYVYKKYLSEKDDMPFIDDRKYDLPADEFDYDKMSAIRALKKFMLNIKYYKNEISYYYTDDPQMFSLYGKDCDNMEIKVVTIILNSKINSGYSRMICFRVANKKFVFYYDLQTEVEDKIEIEENIKYYIRYRSDCDP